MDVAILLVSSTWGRADHARSHVMDPLHVTVALLVFLAGACAQPLPPEPEAIGGGSIDTLSGPQPHRAQAAPPSAGVDALPRRVERLAPEPTALGCGPAEVPCGRFCRDLASDPFNCGQCGAACGSGEVCHASRCATAVAGYPGTTIAAQPPTRMRCAPGQHACRGRCIDLATDDANCSGCDGVCARGTRCVGGRCGEVTP